MNVLVIGSGGREHAILRSLSLSANVKKLYCAPGNAGTSQLAENLQVNIKNHNEIVDLCARLKIDLVIIGPEDPLVDGLADTLRQNKVNVFGPSGRAAQLEGSKIFAKDFMARAGVPTAEAAVVDSVASALKQSELFTAPFILKADGLAAGKGVFICADRAELKDAAEKIFEKRILGNAGDRALLEQNLPGSELSFLVMTDGKSFQALPLAQDHKRLLDGNKGPNTGGMGTVAPMQISETLYAKIIERIVVPSIRQIEKEQMIFRGVLFIGLMVVGDDPYVLEYNVRFGDPETQVILPLISNDIADVFFGLSQGNLKPLQFHRKFAFCLVNAADGYPEQPVKNTPIQLPKSESDVYILHAGTATDEKGLLVSNGGRVLNVVAVKNSLNEARAAAYRLNSSVEMAGRRFRTDIGQYI